METDRPNQTWITIVLITAILMIVFLLFWGQYSGVNNTETPPPPTPEVEQH